MFYTPEKLDELVNEFKTIPVDGDGHSLPVGYSEGYVRVTVLKLAADAKALQAENDQLKEFIATIVNAYHHVLSYDLTQEGVRLVKGPEAIDSDRIIPAAAGAEAL